MKLHSSNYMDGVYIPGITVQRIAEQLDSYFEEVDNDLSTNTPQPQYHLGPDNNMDLVISTSVKEKFDDEWRRQSPQTCGQSITKHYRPGNLLSTIKDKIRARQALGLEATPISTTASDYLSDDDEHSNDLSIEQRHVEKTTTSISLDSVIISTDSTPKTESSVLSSSHLYQNNHCIPTKSSSPLTIQDDDKEEILLESSKDIPGIPKSLETDGFLEPNDNNQRNDFYIPSDHSDPCKLSCDDTSNTLGNFQETEILHQIPKESMTLNPESSSDFHSDELNTSFTGSSPQSLTKKQVQLFPPPKSIEISGNSNHSQCDKNIESTTKQTKTALELTGYSNFPIQDAPTVRSPKSQLLPKMLPKTVSSTSVVSDKPNSIDQEKIPIPNNSTFQAPTDTAFQTTTDKSFHVPTDASFQSPADTVFRPSNPAIIPSIRKETIPRSMNNLIVSGSASPIPAIPAFAFVGPTILNKGPFAILDIATLGIPQFRQQYVSCKRKRPVAYRCTRCGQTKSGHVCEFPLTVRTTGTQVDAPSSNRTYPSGRTDNDRMLRYYEKSKVMIARARNIHSKSTSV